MAFEDAVLGRVADRFTFGPSILAAPFYGRRGWGLHVDPDAWCPPIDGREAAQRRPLAR